MLGSARRPFIAILVLTAAAGCGHSRAPGTGGGTGDEPVVALQLGEDRKVSGKSSCWAKLSWGHHSGRL